MRVQASGEIQVNMLEGMYKVRRVEHTQSATLHSRFALDVHYVCFGNLVMLGPKNALSSSAQEQWSDTH